MKTAEINQNEKSCTTRIFYSNNKHYPKNYHGLDIVKHFKKSEDASKERWEVSYNEAIFHV